MTPKSDHVEFDHPELNLPELDHPEFDHRDRGVAESRWAAVLPTVSFPQLTVSDFSRLIVVSAHPDDESLGAGGLLAAAAEAGLEISVVIATLGEASHPDSPTHTGAQLARLRRAEVFEAVGCVAPTAAVAVLGLPDGGLAEHISELADRIRLLAMDSATLIAVPWLHDAHPDHQGAAEAVIRVAAETGALVLQYPIWWWHWGTPEVDQFPANMVRLDLTPDQLEAKNSAMLSHRSQLAPLSPATGDEAIVPTWFAVHFERDYELFVLVDPGVHERESLSQQYFDDFYQAGPDPWGFETRWYERRKRALTMAALPRERFRRAFEPGCSNGVLTSELAPRCDSLLSTDIAQAPLDVARDRVRAQHVQFEKRQVPQDWPTGSFDLIVISEIGYYCDESDLELFIRRAVAALTDDGVLVACHWRYSVKDYPLDGNAVHRALRREPGLASIAAHVEEDFLLDVFTRPPGVSVAHSSGLLA